MGTIGGNAASPGRSGPVGPFATAGGGLPAQPGSGLDAGISAERLWPADGTGERTAGIGTVSSGGDWAVPVRIGVAPAARHWTLRPAAVAAVPAAGEGTKDLVPQGADLITAALPFDRASLEAALDQFVRQLDELDIRRLVARGQASLVVFVMTALGSAAAMEFARRFWRRRLLVAQGIRVGNPVVREIPLGFPELPGSWSEKVR
jgi:hypothetical protein